jgi:putative peptidoglycan lipid II flippase
MTQTGKHVARAAFLLMITVIISSILGYGREVALYSLIGQNYVTDAYRTAFSIPDFIYMMLVGGALSSSFIPVFSSFIAAGREDDGWKAASIVFNYVMVFLILLIIIAYIYTRPLLHMLAPGLPPEYAKIAEKLTHIMFLQTFFMALNGIAMGVLNSYNRFAAPALGSLVYNLVIIVVGMALYQRFGVVAFSYGVVLGAMLNFAVQIPALKKVGIKYTFSFDYRNEGFHQIMVLFIPVLAGLGVAQLNLFVNQNLASGLGPGMIGALNLGQRIMNMPRGIFAVSIATAVFPTMTMLAARGELESFKKTTSLGIRAVILISIPAAFGLVALGEPLIKLLFEQGQFTAQMAQVTNQALTYYCVGLFAYAVLQILNRGFYALKDTATPVIAAVVTIAINIVLSIILIKSMGHRGLALAYSLAGIVNVLILLFVLKIKVGAIGGGKIAKTFTISLLASLIMMLAVKYSATHLMAVLNLHSKLNLLLGTFLAAGVGVAIYTVLVYGFKLEETELVLNMFRRRRH